MCIRMQNYPHEKNTLLLFAFHINDIYSALFVVIFLRFGLVFFIPLYEIRISSFFFFLSVGEDISIVLFLSNNSVLNP